MAKLSMELVECATALRNLSLSSSVESFEKLIAEGYRYLEELREAPKCNPLQVSGLIERLDRAEALLEQKKKIGL